MQNINNKVKESLEFMDRNPGAVKYGNFINYYEFHPAESRIEMLPINIWKTPLSHSKTDPFTALDLGCNAGNLTKSLCKFLEKHLQRDIRMLGIDIDPVLIERAKELFESDVLKFECADVMSPTFESVLDKFLKTINSNANRFNIIFCFSTTMWIHLNHGDEGLKRFLSGLSQLTEMLVIEPQPWKCYRSALKRTKNHNVFPLFKSLAMKSNVEDDIESFIVTLNMEKIFESKKSSWNRKLLIFTSKQTNHIDGN